MYSKKYIYHLLHIFFLFSGALNLYPLVQISIKNIQSVSQLRRTILRSDKHLVLPPILNVLIFEAFCFVFFRYHNCSQANSESSQSTILESDLT